MHLNGLILKLNMNSNSWFFFFQLPIEIKTKQNKMKPMQAVHLPGLTESVRPELTIALKQSKQMEQSLTRADKLWIHIMKKKEAWKRWGSLVPLWPALFSYSPTPNPIISSSLSLPLIYFLFY